MSPFPREAVAVAAAAYGGDDLDCTGVLGKIGEERSASASADAEETSPEVVVGRDSTLDGRNAGDRPWSWVSLQSSMTESRRE